MRHKETVKNRATAKRITKLQRMKRVTRKLHVLLHSTFSKRFLWFGLSQVDIYLGIPAPNRFLPDIQKYQVIKYYTVSGMLDPFSGPNSANLARFE